MPIDSQKSNSASPKSDSHMGVSFTEIHSDESHQAINAHAAEQGRLHKDTPDSHLSSKGQVFDVGRAFNNENVEIGTIVSDKRKERPTIGDRLGAVFIEWWGGTKTSLNQTMEKVEKVTKQAEKKPVPLVVTKAETRAEVVKEAVTYAAIAPKNNHRVVIQKSRTFKQDVARVTGTPVTLKAPETEKKSEWTHSFEPQKKSVPVTVRTQQKPLAHAAIVDLRGSMVAPVVETRTVEEVRPSIPTPLPPAPIPQPVKEPASTTVKKTVPDFSAIAKIPDSVQKVVTANPISPIRIAPEVQHSSKILSGAVMQPRSATIVPKHAVVRTEIPTWASAKEGAAVPTLPPLPAVPVPPQTPTPLPTLRATTSPVPQNIPTPEPILKVLPREVETVTPVPEPVKRSIEAIFSPTPIVAQATEPQRRPTIEEAFRDAIPITEKVKRTSVVPVPTVRSSEQPQTQEQSLTENPLIRKIARWMILGGITVFAITLAVVLSIYFNVFNKNSGDARETVTTPMFFTVDSQVPVSIGTNKQEFLASLRGRIESAPAGLTQFYPTVPDGAGVRPATSDELLAFLAVNLSGKTIRTLDKGIMIGSITTIKNEPFVVIRSYNFDVLFSGLLAWEPAIYSDFSPLFGTAYRGGGSFSDAVATNKSIRILRDATGAEVLLYSYINQNTVVITTSGEALSKIISHL